MRFVNPLPLIFALGDGQNQQQPRLRAGDTQRANAVIERAAQQARTIADQIGGGHGHECQAEPELPGRTFG